MESSDFDTIIIKNNQNNNISQLHYGGWSIDRIIDEINWRENEMSVLDRDIQSYDGGFKGTHRYNNAVARYSKLYSEVTELKSQLARMHLDNEEWRSRKIAVSLQTDDFVMTARHVIDGAFLFFVCDVLYYLGRYHKFDFVILYHTVGVFALLFIILLLSDKSKNTTRR